VLAFIAKRVYGHVKAGAGFGHTKVQGKSLLVRGLSVFAAVVSTPLAAPVVAAIRAAGAFFSVTGRMDTRVRSAIAAICRGCLDAHLLPEGDLGRGPAAVDRG
jgi:hypothetical protein